MSLAAFQQSFWDALWADTAPQVGCAAAPGFAVYRNTVRKACLDALEANFPSVVAALGREHFRRLAAAYVRRSPPQVAALSAYGAYFAEHLAALLEPALATELPWMARIDRAWIDAHGASDAPLADSTALALLPAEAQARLVLRPHPACRWLWHAELPLCARWRALREPASAQDTPPPAQDNGLLVTRVDGVVRVRAIARVAYVFLDASSTGLSVPHAAQAALDAEPNGDLAAGVATLFAAGAFTTHALANTDSPGD